MVEPPPGSVMYKATPVMRSLKEVSFRDGYATGFDDLLSAFYIPCLNQASQYDRAVGYFRSSFFSLVGVALSEFASRGGHIRLVCNPELTDDDVEAIRQGESLRSTIGERLNEEIDKTLRDPKNIPVVEFLSTIVAAGVVDVRIAFKRNQRGIYHNKVGLFYDDIDNVISFLGTANETLAAWKLDQNHEGIEVFSSWSEPDSKRVQRHRKYFETLWNGNISSLEVLSLPRITEEKLEPYIVSSGIEEASARVRAAFYESSAEKKKGGLAYSPEFSLMDHQKQTIKSWLQNGCQGIVKHATGAGKTITALEILRRWLLDTGPAIVVVPTTILVKQWIKEAEQYLGEDVKILQVGGGNKGAGWESALPAFTAKTKTDQLRLVVATLASASSKRFIEKCQGGSHLLLVADEVHTVGSSTHSNLCAIDAEGRLGLSATPERYGDPDGTQLIFDYFGPILEPQVSLFDAIDAGRLVPYDYFVHSVPLSASEQAEWDDLTAEVKRRYAQLPESRDGKKMQTNEFKLLLIRRASILKQAEAKVELAERVLAEKYNDGERWLVYCDNVDQLEKVNARLQRIDLPTMVYHSAMTGSHEETMQYFGQNQGIMIAIKCLDEGVDVPEASAALILASSSNPREFIQRRGRVLRAAKGKFSAEIHDALVVPSDGSDKETDRVPILRTELNRAAQFARGARNSAATFRIRRLARSVGLSDQDVGLEAFEGVTDD